MTAQRTLFDPPAHSGDDGSPFAVVEAGRSTPRGGAAGPFAVARRIDPDTSHEAAATCAAGTQRRLILTYLARFRCEDHGWVTADVLEAGFPSQAAGRSVWSSRLSALHRAGLVEPCGKRTKEFPSGRTQRVTAYRLTARGREVAS